MKQAKFDLNLYLWARLVEKLIRWKWEKFSEEGLKGDTYRAYQPETSRFLLVSLQYEEWEEGYFRHVRIMDSDGGILVDEKIFSDGGSYEYHPSDVLYELVDGSALFMKVASLSNILANL